MGQKESVAEVALPEPQQRAQHELKYTLPNQAARGITDWLRARLLSDPEYPEGWVSSIYYDSHDLRLLREKVNSDFTKSKVRLRWYLAPRHHTDETAAFLEVKRKIGGRRFKHRVATACSGSELSKTPLQDPTLIKLLGLLRTPTSWIPTNLHPFMEIRFHRLRFLEPATGARVSIDTDIRPLRVNPAMLPMSNPFPLFHAVVEAKGPFRQPPGLLSDVLAFGCRRESFSKYERCYRKVTQQGIF